MYNLLVKLMVFAALIELGKTGFSLSNCHGRGCFAVVNQASRAVLKIDWKPVSVFPEEARKFK